MNKLTKMLVFAIFLSASLAAFAAKAAFGFSTTVQTEGFFFSPKLKQVRISSVTPGSPADTAGLRVKDDIISANGRTIAGQSATEMSSYMSSLKPGDRLILVVKRADGSEATITIIAGSK